MAETSTALSPLSKIVAFRWLHQEPGRRRDSEILFCLLRDDGSGGEDLSQGGPTYFSRITVKKKNHHCESQGSWSLIRDGLVLTDFACCPGMAQHWNFTFHRVQGQGRHLVWDNVDGSVYRSITFLGKFLVPMAGVWRQAFDPWPMSSAIETVMRRLSGTMNGSLSSLFSSFFNMMPLGLE